MNQVPRSTLLLLVLACLWLPAARPATADPAIMPPSEVRAGMKGYGRTVFHGTRVESFPITVLGVVHHFLAEEDLILFKVDGGYLKQKGLGIVAGMSGSPVYVNGRMIGAVAYGWSYAKEPIGGITPITAMLKELPGGEPAQAGQVPSAGPHRLETPVRVAGRDYHYVALDPGGPVSPDTMTLRPAGSILEMRGWSPHAIQALSPLFHSASLVPVSSVMVGSADIPKGTPMSPLEPGSSIGVQMVSGDLDMSATGTLTYISGHRFVGFGHPMAQMGQVHLPLTEAYVFNIYPSAQSPFKIASQLGVVGELTNDYYYAIGGTLGVHPDTLPVTITVDDEQRHQHKVLHLRIFQHPLFTPALLAAAASQAISSTSTLLGDTTARISYDIRTADEPEALKFYDTETSVSIDSSVSGDVSRVFQKLAVNEFKPTHLENVALHVQILPGKRSAVIQQIFLDQDSYKPGQTITVGVQLKPFNEAPVVRTFKVPVPIDAEKGSVKLAVSSGAELSAVRKRLSISEPRATSLGEVYQQVVDEDKNGDLVVSCVFPSNGAVVGGEKYSFLPQSMREVIPQLNSSAIIAEKDLYTARQSVPWVVSGSQTVAFDVQVPKDNTGFKPTQAAVLQAASKSPTPQKTPEEKTAKAAKVVATPATAGPDVKVLPSSTHRWLLADSGFLQRGRLDGVMVGDDGTLSLGPHLTKESSSLTDVGWAMATGPNGMLAVAYGPPARIVIQDGGNSRTVDLPANSIQTLLVDRRGTLYAGTGPRGHVYAIGPDHKPRLVLDSGSRYVWALAEGPDGDVYCGTGLPGAVWRLHGDHPDLVFRTDEPHVRSLAVAPDGTIYAGTGNRGAILRYSGGTVAPVCTTAYGSVDGLVFRDAHTLLAGSGKALYELEGDSVRVIDLKTGPVVSMTGDGDRTWIGTGDGRLYVYDGKDVSLVQASESGPTMALALASADVLALHGSPSELDRLSHGVAPQGSWESPVLDASDTSQWGSIRWHADVPGGSKVEVLTRSGNVPEPDSTWSGWSRLADGRVASPPGRYLQLKVAMASNGAATPSVDAMTVYYRPRGKVARVTFTAPATGDAWSGTHKITWKTESDHGEDLSFDVDASSDDRTWKPVARGHRAAVKERGLSSDDHASNDDTVEWDTKGVPDGVYRVRVTVTDPSSPTTTFVSPPVSVVNTRPAVSLKGARYDGGRVHLQGTARATLVPVLEVSYRLDGGDWHAAQADDGLFDSPSEAFTVDQAVDKKPAAIEVRVSDEAGNVTTEKASL